MVYHASGLWETISKMRDEGEEPELIEMVKRVGLHKYDTEALCEFFAE
jgi:hypothetical protein